MHTLMAQVQQDDDVQYMGNEYMGEDLEDDAEALLQAIYERISYDTDSDNENDVVRVRLNPTWSFQKPALGRLLGCSLVVYHLLSSFLLPH